MVEVMKIMVTSFKRPHAHTVLLSALDPAAGLHQPMSPLEIAGHNKQVWVSLFWGHCFFLLGSGAQKFLFVHSKSLFPWGFSVLSPDPQVGKSVVGPTAFTTVLELLCYNCSPVCGSSAQQLYSGMNGDLFQEDLCHTCHASQDCCRQSPCPHGRSLLTHNSAGDTQMLKGRSDLVSCGGQCSFQYFVCSLQASLPDMRFDFKHDCALPTILFWLLCP